jgi:hypothetical protein
MTARQWALVIIGALVLTGVLAHFQWFRCYEYVAIWLEGIALVLIFGLDFFERVRQVKERKEEQEQWAKEMQLSRDQLRATADAAIATKQSADIQSALNRPLLGLEPPTLESNINETLWTIALTMKNHGSLSALETSMSYQFLVDSDVRSAHSGPESIEIFPRATHTITSDFTWQTPAERLALIQNGSVAFRISVTIDYGADDGRHFGFICEAKYSRGIFVVENSKTYLKYTVKTVNPDDKPLKSLMD